MPQADARRANFDFMSSADIVKQSYKWPHTPIVQARTFNHSNGDLGISSNMYIVSIVPCLAEKGLNILKFPPSKVAIPLADATVYPVYTLRLWNVGLCSVPAILRYYGCRRQTVTFVMGHDFIYNAWL